MTLAPLFPSPRGPWRCRRPGPSDQLLVLRSRNLSSNGKPVNLPSISGQLTLTSNGFHLYISIAKAEIATWPKLIHLHLATGEINDISPTGEIARVDLQYLIDELSFHQSAVFGKCDRPSIRPLYCHLYRTYYPSASNPRLRGSYRGGRISSAIGNHALRPLGRNTRNILPLRMRRLRLNRVVLPISFSSRIIPARWKAYEVIQMDPPSPPRPNIIADFASTLEIFRSRISRCSPRCFSLETHSFSPSRDRLCGRPRGIRRDPRCWVFLRGNDPGDLPFAGIRSQMPESNSGPL